MQYQNPRPGYRDEDENQDEDWFQRKRYRITASMAHKIANTRFANGQTETAPASYVNAIRDRGVNRRNAPTNWEKDMEGVAIRQYQKLKSASLGQQVVVQKCGVIFHPELDWLAADPAGIVMDYETRQQLLCLEVNCPFEHKNRRVEDVCRDDPRFYLEMQDQDGRRPGEAPVYSLKKSNEYFTQVQYQLAVTGLPEADLVVFTLEELAIVPVTFDSDWWDKIYDKLNCFYRGAIQPRLSEWNQQDMAAASTSEL